MPPLAIALISEYYMKRKPQKYISATLKLLILLLIIDLVSILLFPNGMYENYWNTANWFLGYKTERVRAVCMPVLLFSSLNDISNKGKLSAFTWILAVVAVIDIFLSGATGGLVATLVFCIMIFLINFASEISRYLYKIFNFKILIATIIILNVIVVILQDLSLFETFITDILGKEMTLTGRTIIWALSWKYALKSPILGHGFIISSEYEKITGVLAGTSPHNLFLGVFVYTGIVGIVVFFSMIYFAISCTNKKKFDCSTICMIYVIAYLILGISSFNMYGQYNYAVIICLYYFFEYRLSGNNTDKVECNNI